MVDYRELPGVYSLDAALAPGAHLVQDPSIRPGHALADTNVLEDAHYAWGDIEAEEARTAVVVENTYTFPMVTHFPIEPGGTVAVPTESGGLDIYSPVQHPYLLQRTIASVLGLPLNQVRVFAPDPGGGFGGKQNPKLEPLLAFLALHTRRTCRIVLSLEETFQSMRRAGCRITARTGFTDDGELTFHRLEADFQIGAYADVAPRVMGKGSYVAAGPYRIPGVRIDARAVMTNTTPSTAFRGFGSPAGLLGDGVPARRRRAAAGPRRPGDPAAEPGRQGRGVHPRRVGRRRRRRVAAEPGEGRRADRLGDAAAAEPGPGHRGGHQARRDLGPVAEPGAAAGRRQRDRLRGHLRHGPGRAHAVAADRRRRARDAAGPGLASSAATPAPCRSTCRPRRAGRRSSWARPCSRPARTCAGACWSSTPSRRGWTADELAERPACCVTPDGELPLPEAARQALGSLRGEFIGQGTRRLRGKSKHPLGGDAAFYEFNATAIEVEVDRETGELLLTRHVTVSDVGTELNPLQVVSQDEGAAIMGLGHSQMEQLLLDEHGRIRNLGALDYRIPTFKDVPVELLSAAVENHDGPGPYGSKGISEGALLCTAGALGAAVADAIGVVIRDLPLTPERVWTALQDADPRRPLRVTPLHPSPVTKE